MKPWTPKEIIYLKGNYSKNLNKDLSKGLKRSLKAIGYTAHKLKLKKDKDFYSKSRKHTSIIFSKELIRKLYLKEEKSMRKIAKELGVGKTTIEYYLKKFKIKRRTHSDANKIRFLHEDVWTKGLTKETDSRIKKMSSKLSKTYKEKREQKVKEVENKFRKSLKELLRHLYWDKKMNQKQISKKLGFDRSFIIAFMKDFKIPKRLNYEYISSLKGENHPMHGKSWESIFGRKEATRRKKDYAKRFKELTIRRLEKNEFPFFDTKIEKMMAKEMLKRKILFVKQFRILNKFVCDFAIPYLKIAVECDGDYWHANPKVYDRHNLTKVQENKIKTDKIKDKSLKEKGWTLLRFFESDIKSNVKECADAVEKEVKKKMKQLKKIKSPLDELMK